MQEDVIDNHGSGRFAMTARPLAALASGARFLMNIQETSHFFRMTDAIDGAQNERNYQRFLQTRYGKRLDDENVRYAELLSDVARLAAYPEESLASAYLSFMDVENLGLELLMEAEQTAQASTLDLDPSRRIYMENGIVLHDIFHVVLGYGRDPVGEACLLAFTADQFKLRGISLLAHVWALREQARRPRQPIMGMLREAKEMSQHARWVADIDWREFIGRPPQEARDFLGLKKPRVYLAHFKAACAGSYGAATLPRAA